MCAVGQAQENVHFNFDVDMVPVHLVDGFMVLQPVDSDSAALTARGPPSFQL
jgi:hypothetical protein